MTGYRAHSFDPNGSEPLGEPLKPYNRTQKLGFALATIGVMLAILHFAVRFGLLPSDFDVGTMPGALAIIGVALIYSRRAKRDQDPQGAN